MISELWEILISQIALGHTRTRSLVKSTPSVNESQLCTLYYIDIPSTPYLPTRHCHFLYCESTLDSSTKLCIK
jgi:hypothetical protein